uniref:YCII-related domain-containing protein n=1 Tax=Streptoalloteichus sp. ATCC 53650 TaxID=756733 RepID=K4P0V4_9PSEU|nr:hypothetical protein [Streptoalloteichus sp. ATCC 53650]
MFLAVLTYRADLSEVDELKPTHLEYVQQQVDAGYYLLCGRKNPRTGGVILADGLDREKLARILDDDPFVRGGVAEYEITEFVPTRASEAVVATLGLTL